MKHYVYRITNTTINKHYYGTRSALNPQEDLGIKYFSTSSDKSFITEQKEKPHNFKYKIVSFHSTRKLALAKEIKLHIKFNVKSHISFYNKANQTSTGFDTTGQTFNFTDEHKQKMSDSAKVKVFTEAHRNNIGQARKGKTHTNEAKQKIGNAQLGDLNHRFGKTHTIEAKQKISLANIGSKNSMTKSIKIYNSNDKLMFISDGNFSKFCEDNNLPYLPLLKSYRNNSRKIYPRKCDQGKAIKSGFKDYIGWYSKLS